MRLSRDKQFYKIFLVWIIITLFWLMLPGGAWALKSTETVTTQNYSNLAALVAMVGENAIKSFYDFFGPSQIIVEPFTVLSTFSRKRSSILAATMADHMTAMINNKSIAQYFIVGKHEQQLHGVLQELDGFLRIHISGVNSIGERRSYVVNVEMSESIHRALHSYIR